MKEKLISIVVPVFNSEPTIIELCNRIDTVFAELNYSYQLILVDDGSKDNSWKEIEKLNQQFPNLLAVRLTKNFGQHAALLSGFTFCKGEIVITLDDDLQHPPEEIKKMIHRFEETNADVVYGLPKNKQHSNLRNVSSKAVTLTSADGHHQGSSFRLIKIEFIEKIIQNHRFNFLFLDALLNWYTSNFESVEVEHHTRKKGKSGYNFLKLFQLHFKTMINYSVLPLRLIIYGGMALSIFTFVIGLWFIFKKIFFSAPLGYTSIIVAILFTSSLIILGLGFIGLYVHKIYEYNLQKPNYFVNQILPAKNDH